jgi:hypothetical protein
MDTVRTALALRARDIVLALQKSKQQRQIDAAAAANAAAGSASADGTAAAGAGAENADAASIVAASNRLTAKQQKRLEMELLRLKTVQLQHNCRQKVSTTLLMLDILVVNYNAWE